MGVDIRLSNGYALQSDRRQWIVGQVDEREDTEQEVHPHSRTFHQNLSSALSRILGEQLRESEVEDIKALVEVFEDALATVIELETKFPTPQEIQEMVDEAG